MYRKKIEDVLKSCHTSLQGLSQKTAQHRLEKNGYNKLQEGKRKTILQKFLAQFKDVLIMILILSCILSMVLGIVNRSTDEFVDAGFILFVVIINAIIGVIQENKAENALDNLKNLTKPYAKVLRDGITQHIKTEELVVGDIVLLEAGDIVPADLRLVDVNSLKIEESALTGESQAVEKQTHVIRQENVAIGDQKNMAFMGSVVCYGRGMGVVVATGIHTEMGKISQILADQTIERTPLQQRIDHTSKILSVIVIILSIAIFVSEMVYGMDWAHAFMVAISIAVCAIPEGLPTGVTITMAIGVQQMSKKKAIVKHLAAVETLGSTQVICTDKTGTLTLNQMTVVESFCLSVDQVAREQMLFCMALCNDVHVHKSKDKMVTLGDPTETALVEYAYAQNVAKMDLLKKYPMMAEIPFDSNRKMMSTIHQMPQGIQMYTKGGVDQILEKCTHILENGKERILTEEDKEVILKKNSEFAKQALRVLAYATKNIRHEKEQYLPEDTEKNLCFLGITGMIDPPREEVKQSIVTCQQAGIEVVMITGDHKDTAFAIAKELGIAESEKQVLTGKELNTMTEQEIMEKVPEYRVFARVSPENKVQIVKAWQNHHKIVAMTGDGVNDAPSIKCADIGVGMGITGTDVTKGVADIILTDDNFSTIVGAVEEGRKIYRNILKIVQFLLGTGMAEMILLFVIIALMGQSFFTPALILWINFVSDTLPALALGVEQAEKDMMKCPPNPNRKNLFAGVVGLNILIFGVLQACLVFGVYFVGLYGVKLSPVVVNTMCFATLVMIELFHSYNLRHDTQSLFGTNIFSNRYLNGAFFISLLLTVLIIVLPIAPLQNAFGVHTLTVLQWLCCVGVAILIIPMAEIYKLIKRKLAQRRK